MSMTLLVTGGRRFGAYFEGKHMNDTNREQDFIYLWLSAFHKEYNVTKLVTGGARGVDSVAAEWAEANNIDCINYPITQMDWKMQGKKAGMLRNQKMLESEKIDCVIAFPGGSGTEDMIHRALTKDIPVQRTDCNTLIKLYS